MASEEKKPPEKNYITPAGFRRLQSEFEELRLRTRREVVQKLAEAAAEGDRSENAEYIYRKKQLREIDRRIRFLLRRMTIAEVIDPSQHKSDRVCFGAVVTVEDDAGKSSRYQIVGVDESEPREGRISWNSPIGRALVGRRVDDVVTVRVNAGDRELSIVEIDFPSGGAASAAGDARSVQALQKEAQAALAAAGGDADDDAEEEEDVEADGGPAPRRAV